MSFVHITRDGQRIRLSRMTDSHLENTMRMIKRRAKEGITIRWGGGYEAQEMWYDEEELFGKEALRAMSYHEYEAEWKRRHP